MGQSNAIKSPEFTFEEVKSFIISFSLMPIIKAAADYDSLIFFLSLYDSEPTKIKEQLIDE